jgi:hypothetical protein
LPVPSGLAAARSASSSSSSLWFYCFVNPQSRHEGCENTFAVTWAATKHKRKPEKVMKSKHVRILLSLTIMSMIVVFNILGQTAPPAKTMPTVTHTQPALPASPTLPASRTLPASPTLPMQPGSPAPNQPAWTTNHPAWATNHPAWATNHPAWATNHPAWTTNHPAWTTNHPAWATNHPAWATNRLPESPN